MNNLNGVCVLIISVLHFNDKKLSYSKKRSFFSFEERLKQTKKTIKSVRNKIPNAEIIFIELGLVDVYKDISVLVDRYFFIGNNAVVRLLADSSKKGLGESVGLLYSCNKFGRNKKIFKISGRYFLNDDFDLNSWNFNKFVFLKQGSSISTRLYAFPKKFLLLWVSSILFSLPFLLFNISIEISMPLFIPKFLVKKVNRLGVSGFIGVNGENINE